MAYTLKPEEVGVLPSVVWEKSEKNYMGLNTKMKLSSSMLGLNSQKMTCLVSTMSFLTTLISWTISTASRLS